MRQKSGGVAGNRRRVLADADTGGNAPDDPSADNREIAADPGQGMQCLNDGSFLPIGTIDLERTAIGTVPFDIRAFTAE